LQVKGSPLVYGGNFSTTTSKLGPLYGEGECRLKGKDERHTVFNQTGEKRGAYREGENEHTTF